MTLGIKVSKDLPDKEKINPILFKQGVSSVQQAFPPWRGNDFNATTHQLPESNGQISPFSLTGPIRYPEICSNYTTNTECR